MFVTISTSLSTVFQYRKSIRSKIITKFNFCIWGSFYLDFGIICFCRHAYG